MDDTITINDEILSTVKSAIKAALVYESLTGGKRKLGITGEVGEILTCYHLGLRLSIDPRSEGFDAIDKDGLRVQIKSRKSESKGMPRDVGRTGIFSKHKFDFALLSILDNNYQLCEVWRAEHDVLHPIIERNKRRNPSLSSFKKVGRKIFEAGSKLNEVQEDKMEENSQEKKATRKEAIEYLKKHLGELPQGVICASKLYPPEKSWTKSPGWWLRPELKNLNRGENVHLVCRKENGKDFYYLCVPVKDIEEYLKKNDLEIRPQKGEEFIHLELSARHDDLFQDLRKGRVNFAKYLVKLQGNE